MFKRIGLLILANLAIFIMLSVILTVIQMVFGINFGTMSGKSLNLGTLFVFAMVVGFSGSIISLLISLVAVSTGLLNLMNREEVEAVLAHELSHVKNGDMVTMTLLQGVMNTFVVFLSRIIGWVVDRQILRNEDDAPGVGYYVTSLVLDICLGFLASMVVAAFSRYREFHADAGAADIMGSTTPMINALQRLGGIAPNELPGNVKGFGISGGIGSLFASHPSIEDRVAALREHRYTNAQ